MEQPSLFRASRNDSNEFSQNMCSQQSLLTAPEIRVFIFENNINMTESAISRNTYINLTRGELATVATACPGRTLETIGLDLVFFCEVIDYTHCDKNLDNFRATV